MKHLKNIGVGGTTDFVDRAYFKMASVTKLVSELPLDNELMEAVTASLQAQEKLSSLMRNKLDTNPSAASGKET